MSVQVDCAEVALQAEEVVAVVEACLDVDVAYGVARVGILHREVGDVDLSLRIVDVAALDVACGCAGELCTVPLRCDVERSRCKRLHVGGDAQMWGGATMFKQSFYGGTQVGVVDGCGAVQCFIDVVGFKVDVAIGVVVEADVVNASAHADVVLRAALCVERERHDASFVAVEQLAELELVCLNVRTHGLLLLCSRQFYAACSAVELCAQRAVGICAVGFCGERYVAEAVHDVGQFVACNGLVNRANSLVRSEETAHFRVPYRLGVAQNVSFGIEDKAVVDVLNV